MKLPGLIPFIRFVVHPIPLSMNLPTELEKMPCQDLLQKTMTRLLVACFITGLILGGMHNTWLLGAAAGGTFLFACYFTRWLLPHKDLYKYVQSTVMGLFLVQYTYQLHGPLELCLFAFIPAALLLGYRNWKLLLPLAIVVIADQLLIGYYRFFTGQRGSLMPAISSGLYMSAIQCLLTLIIFLLFGLGAFYLQKTWLGNMAQRYESAQLRKAYLQNEFITELSENLRQSNDLLSQANHELEIIFKSIEAVIFSYDCTQQRFKHVSAACEKIFGYAPGEFIADNQFWYSIVHRDDRQCCPGFDTICWNGKPLSYKYRIVQKNGSVRWMETKLVPSLNEAGIVARIDGICNDITNRTELEKALAEEIREKQREITAAVITAQENERYFLGEELHDNINPILSTARLYIDCVLSGDERQQHLLSESKDFIGTAINEIRTLSKSLIPPSLGDIGLVEALEDMVNNIRAVNKLNFICAFDDVDENLLSSNLKLTIFRIVQEQLNNVMKHANAQTVWLTLHCQANKIQLAVKDDGIGFDARKKRNGVGLQNITSRTELCNGEVQIITAPGRGCELMVNFVIDINQNCVEVGLRA